MSNIKQPKKGEYWHVQYGINSQTGQCDKNNILAQVLEDVEITVGVNWRTYNFKCKTQSDDEILIHGMCFVEKYN